MLRQSSSAVLIFFSTLDILPPGRRVQVAVLRPVADDGLPDGRVVLDLLLADGAGGVVLLPALAVRVAVAAVHQQPVAVVVVLSAVALALALPLAFTLQV